MLQALGCGQHNSVIELGRITEGKPNESPQGRNYRALTALADVPEDDAGHLHLAFLPARRLFNAGCLFRSWPSCCSARAAPVQRSGTATGRARAGPNRVLCAPVVGCDAQRVVHLASGRGRPEREPGHARAALNRRRKKERPRLRAREGLAGGFSRSGASGRGHLFQIRGRGEHEHGLLPPLRPCRG